MKTLFALLILAFSTIAAADLCTVVIRDQYGYDYDSFTRSSYSVSAACDDASFDCRQKLSDYQSYGSHYNSLCVVKEISQPSYPSPSYPYPYPAPYPPSYPYPREPQYPREPNYPRYPREPDYPRYPREPNYPRQPNYPAPRDPREPPRHEPGSEPRRPGPGPRR